MSILTQGQHINAAMNCNTSMFGFVQGLFNAMREYQCKAPLKLMNKVLELVLWNKVPVELQTEVKRLPLMG